MKRNHPAKARSTINPVALVTGASRGLGKEIALALSESGYVIGINYLNSKRDADAVAEEAVGKSLLLQADVGNSYEVGEIIEKIQNDLGRLDVVVNNAGITRDNLLLRQSEKEWDEILGTNLKGFFNMIRCAAPLITKSGGGHIVNISSYSGLKGKAGQAAYSASKAAVLGLTYTSAIELAPQGIKVNAVLPGYLSTGMGMNSPAMEKAREMSVLKTLSSPREAARFIATLVQTENITGQFFSLDSRII